MGAKLAPVQKCGNYGYQNMYFIFYIWKCLTVSMVSQRQAVKKSANKTNVYTD
jgi:hypothetical protein